MNYSQYLTERLKEVLTEGKWVTGSNFFNEISQVSYEQASTKWQECNTISELTFHLDYYVNGVANALESGELTIRDKYSFDAPALLTHQDWDERVERFKVNAERLIQLIEQMENDKIVGDFIDPKYGSMFRNIDVMIEHAYYHLGQVKLIRKHL